jgi:hypothetical protein
MAVISLFTITNAVLTTNVITYTGTITSGTSPMIKGTPIIVAGCVNAAFNGNFQITGGTLTTTLTVALTHANIGSEAESGATATYDPEGMGMNPSAQIPVSPDQGDGYLREPVTSNIVLGNYIPGTLPGGSQQIIVF